MVKKLWIMNKLSFKKEIHCYIAYLPFPCEVAEAGLSTAHILQINISLNN